MNIVGIIEDLEEAKMIERIMKVAVTGRVFSSLIDRDKMEEEDREINAIIDAEINRLKVKNATNLKK